MVPSSDGLGETRDSSRFHRRDLVFGVALAARDDRAGMAHAAARRRGAAGDEADDGLLRPRLASSARNCAASSSALPPISPIMMIDLVSSSARNSSSTSMKLVPVDRIAADADRGGLAEALVGGLEHRLIGQRAGAADDADAALREDVAGHDADLALARASARPGSSGRSAATSSRSSARLTLTMSSTGMPSVIATISGTSASIASRIESAAKGGGT